VFFVPVLFPYSTDAYVGKQGHKKKGQAGARQASKKALFVVPDQTPFEEIER
jgi:hypothetical protein